jgi:hypothetical protein
MSTDDKNYWYDGSVGEDESVGEDGSVEEIIIDHEEQVERVVIDPEEKSNDCIVVGFVAPNCILLD